MIAPFPNVTNGICKLYEMGYAALQMTENGRRKKCWHLWNGVAPDIEPIPRAALENADRQDVADRMVQRYQPSQ
ncbi:hypothetical protein QQF64_000271 [Cirrhinus molitorella]|uniref:Pyrin domain-containing protein n=1 Tax=Cirrhinus molitorella TaxID=172907 RepID=A0ABR3NXN9_9TELE